MKRKLVFATNNAHKLEEIAAILGDKVELLSLNDIDCHTDIPETAETLEGNALLKSSFIYRNYQLDCFADDTGLEVEALNGAPGVYSSEENYFFAKKIKRNEENCIIYFPYIVIMYFMCNEKEVHDDRSRTYCKYRQLAKFID